jgi:hypothetical protein
MCHSVGQPCTYITSTSTETLTSKNMLKTTSSTETYVQMFKYDNKCVHQQNIMEHV